MPPSGLWKTLLALLLLVAINRGFAVEAQAQEPPTDLPDPAAPKTAALRDIVFGATLPTSVFTSPIVVGGVGTDLAIFAQDCCIRDDVVEIRIERLDLSPAPEPCLLARVDSRGGTPQTHAGETHKVSLPRGTFRVEYRNTVSGPGESGWSVAETLSPFTNRFSCRCPQFHTDRVEFEIVQPLGAEQACGPDSVGERTPKWGRFGVRGFLGFDFGDELELFCNQQNADAAPQFHLIYKPPTSQRKHTVGMCPFEGGFNRIAFEHLGDFDRNGNPDCLLGTLWRSRDFGENDDPNPWTGERGETLLDWAVMVFDATRQDLVKESYKFEYLRPPPLDPGDGAAEGQPRRDLWVRIDPPLGPETDAFFAEVVERFTALPPGAPMLLAAERLCDLDGDGSCDEADFTRFRSALGNCFEDDAYDPAADADSDGCVEEADGKGLFALIIDVGPGRELYALDPRSKWKVHVAVLASELSIDPGLLDPGTFTFGSTGSEASPEDFAYRDVDGDGDLDLQLRFSIAETGLACGDTEMWLRGQGPAGEPLASFDKILTVGCR